MSGTPAALPLPRYRHRPGRTPHPERDPAGHRFLERLPPGFLPAESVPLAALPDAALFRYGERLFRAQYWWEAHAVWEELWRAAAPGSPERGVLRAFIQLAAAALREELGGRRGSRKLLAAARQGMDRANGHRGAAAIRTRFEALSAEAGLASAHANAPGGR